MSDTKSAAGSILTKLCNARRNSDIRADDEQFLTLLDAAYAVQAKRIEELESQLVGMVPVIYADLMEKERDAAIQQVVEIRAELEREERFRRDTSLKLHSAIQRAEAAEREITLQLGEHSTFWNSNEETAIECISRLGQDKERAESLLLQIQAALPAEGALKIASKLYHRTNSPEAVNALRAYAAALGKEG